MRSKILNEDEILPLVKELPTEPHALFRNRLGNRVGRLEVKFYLGKISDRHSWAAECDCGSGFVILCSTRLVTTESCGCLNSERTREANIGNNRGSLNTKTDETIDRLRDVKPSYRVLDSKDGKVMTKWDFVCSDCEETFTARPDNILPRKSGGNQTPCGCRKVGGYSNLKDGTFYILSIGDYCKFGITNNLDKRYKQLCSSYGSELKLEFVLVVPDGKVASAVESGIKEKFNYSVDVGNIDGKTEYRRIEHCQDIIKEAIKISTEILIKE